jgi:hypothetical protein
MLRTATLILSLSLQTILMRGKYVGSHERIPVSWTNTNNSEQNNPQNDIVVKSEKHEDLINNFKKIFDNLYKFKMMLNSKKMCI